MGRQQYLTRLALGRSAFDGECDPVAVDNDQHHPADDETSATPYVQQYDNKGRPVNPSSEARNTALRHAENAALALVGVVERKDNHDRLNELKYRTIRLAREDVLAAEQDAGENVDLLVTLLTFLQYASGTLVCRVQAGVYPSSDSFATILARGLSAMREGGVRRCLAILFPGAPAAMLYATARVLLGATLSTGVEYFDRLIRTKLRPRTARRVNHAFYFLCEAIFIALDATLLPLEYYAYAQRLGLAPSRPVLPSWKILIPTNPTSLHHFGWHSRFAHPILHRLCSPAALMLLQTTLWREQDAEIPIATQLTRFQYPDPFNAPPETVRPPRPTHDPLGWLFHQAYTLRTRLLHALGYTLEHHPDSPRHEADRPRHPSAPLPDDHSSIASWSDLRDSPTTPRRDPRHPIHRSTDLARAAPKLLADRLDLAVARLLLLPLHALVARAVAHAYTAHPLLPPTPLALSARPHLYVPFRGPVTLGAGEWMPYLSHLGLSLAVHAANTAGTFFLVAALARWQGRKWYDWGARGKVGGLVYPAEGEE